MFEKGPSRRFFFAGLLAIFLLGVFISVNYYRSYQDSHQIADPSAGVEREKLPAGLEGNGKLLAFHDFESGNASDTTSHLSFAGHSGKQSLKMSSKVPFSPGLWIKFKDLIPVDFPLFKSHGSSLNHSQDSSLIKIRGLSLSRQPDPPLVDQQNSLWTKPYDSLWIRATGYVWFSCPPSEAKCSLVITCNHNGINYKYMSIPIEKEAVKPNQWNRISIDYHIPSPPDREDVLQAYFWYRGMGGLLVDDIEVTFFAAEKK
jgi:hypothetical protein